jgi:hypothetical protein
VRRRKPASAKLAHQLEPSCATAFGLDGIIYRAGDDFEQHRSGSPVRHIQVADTIGIPAQGALEILL